MMGLHRKRGQMNNWDEYPGPRTDSPLHTESPYRWGAYWNWEGKSEGYKIVLPHQCDEWRIGTEAGAQALIDDLQRLIEEGPPDEPPRYAR